MLRGVAASTDRWPVASGAPGSCQARPSSDPIGFGRTMTSCVCALRTRKDQSAFALSPASTLRQLHLTLCQPPAAQQRQTASLRSPAPLTSIRDDGKNPRTLPYPHVHRAPLPAFPSSVDTARTTSPPLAPATPQRTTFHSRPHKPPLPSALLITSDTAFLELSALGKVFGTSSPTLLGKAKQLGTRRLGTAAVMAVGGVGTAGGAGGDALFWGRRGEAH